MQRLLDRRLRRALFLAWWLAWAVIFLVSLRPVPEPLQNVPDKLLHVVAHAAMVAAAAGFCHSPIRLLGWAAVAVLLGAAIELAQGLVPWRSAELADLLADIGGAATGWLMGSLWLVLVTRPLARHGTAP